ncbi:MAG: hypothetical protein KIT80_03115 [Chitinophagaceae bacterium]|nr:hypothetical protein [Chitinophagaceae bacterium]MCW5925875.1 hypothetical protein [Chitinophagaceae bacterium]
MKKIFFLLAGFLFFGSIAIGQVTEGVVEFNKVKRTVKQMEINHEPEIVEKSIISRMAKSGYKPSTSKGWMIFKGVNDPEISDTPCDLHVKVERKSRKEKDVSLVHFFISKPDDHTTAVAMAGPMLTTEGFHGKIKEHSQSHQLEKDILQQEDATKKAQKKYDDLVKDQASLEKKIRDLQSDLESNIQKQESQLKELENQKKVLETLKQKRSPVN